MKMEEVREKAKGLGIKTGEAPRPCLPQAGTPPIPPKRDGARSGHLKKADLIREIQKAEINSDCFGRTQNYCDQWDCGFREDRLPSNEF